MLDPPQAYASSTVSATGQGTLRPDPGFPDTTSAPVVGLDIMKPRLYIIAMATNSFEPIFKDAGLEQNANYFAARRTRTWPRRILSPSLQFLLWSLRVYVFVMLNVVAIEVMRALVA